MSDLVLGLLVLGVCLFAGVLIYNRWQERSAKGAAERAFGSRHADALMETAPAPARREPTLEARTLPDERVDYVIELQKPIAAPLVLEGWRAIEQRFGRRALLAQAEDGSWRAALQMVNRAGVVSDAELIEFRSEVETLGARLGTTFSSPEMREALEAARALDRTCAENDIQVALHVVGPAIEPALGEQPFQVVRRENGLTLVLDVALTADLARSYETMARAGRSLAESHGARLVDDRGNVLDERSLAAIGGQLEAVRQALAGHGIETGSPLAQRLFS